jgi:Na+-transporting NADH:ubiquinone oxidoreductase subunit B
MKFLRNLLDGIKPHFEEGGKLSKYYPVYDGFETFLFTPNHVSHNGSHIKDAMDLKRTMVTVILALVPCLLFGIWNTGHQHFLAIGEFVGVGEGFVDKFLYGALKVLPILVVSYGVGLGIEFGFCIINKHSINEGFLVSGILIPLVMPAEVPLWMVAISTAFAVIFGKEVFGGTGMNILNPALTARAFLFFAYPTKMSGDKVWVAGLPDGTSGATALGDLASFTQETPVFANLDQFYAKYSFMDSFLGIIPGSIGETSALACILGAIMLIYTGVGSWRIMLSFLAGGYLMSYLFNLWGANQFMMVDPVHQLMLGGFMFGMVFMITDPVSATQTNTGKWIYGFLGGFLAILIRVFNPAYPEGVMLAILFVNVMAPLIDHYVVQANIKRRMNRVKIA